MTPTEAGRIRANPVFAELERKRSGFSWTLTALILVIYFGFILLVAFAPGVMATRITPSISLGFPLGLGVILSAIVLTGIYVLRANTEFDRMTQEIVSGVPAQPAPLATPAYGDAR